MVFWVVHCEVAQHGRSQYSVSSAAGAKLNISQVVCLVVALALLQSPFPDFTTIALLTNDQS